MNPISSLIRGAALAALAASALPAHAQWISLPTTGTVLQTVNPKVVASPQPTSCTNNPGGAGPSGEQVPVEVQSATLATGKFATLPPAGYILRHSASYVLNTGSPAKNVGTLYDRAYCQGTGTTCTGNSWVLASRVILNTTIANPPNLTFEVNDLFRTVPAGQAVAAGYYMGTSGTSVNTGLATKYLEFVGRTNNGLAQTIVRDNTKVAFRADVNASDPERCEPLSKNSPISPWMYVRVTCSSITTTGAGITFKTRVRQGGEEDQPVVSITTSGFVCNP